MITAPLHLTVTLLIKNLPPLVLPPILNTDDEDKFSSTCTATFSLSADDHAPNNGQQPTTSTAIWLPTTTSIRSVFSW